MQCTSPRTGWRHKENGKIVTSLKEAHADRPVTTRCGTCIGCRLHLAYEWGIRATHEASLHESSMFVTLTYSDENLPYGGTLERDVMPKFIKRLRKRVRVRTFYCGEYGSQTWRPHYHALIFGWCPSDKELMAQKDGKNYYRSNKLDTIWSLGHCNFSDVTMQSAAYTAGYTTKKIYGEKAREHYEWIDQETGQIVDRLPEFSGQSLKPGIGEPWLRKWLMDTYPKGTVIVNGREIRAPRYYDEIVKRDHPELWRETKARRRKDAPRWSVKEREFFDEETQKIIKFRAPHLLRDDGYYGSGRQMLARRKINESRQKLRTAI